MIEKNIRLEPHHSRDLLVGRRSDGRRPGYQPPGHRDAPAPSRGGGGGGGGGGHHVDTAAAQRAQAVADSLNAQRAEAERASNLAEARKLMTQPTTVDVPIKGPELIPGTTGPFVADPYQQNYISPGEVSFKDRYQTGDYADLVQGPVDVGFQNILREQKIAEDLRQKQQDPDYGQFFRPQPVVEKPKTGIGGALKTMGKGALEMALMPFLPKPVRTAWQAKKRYDALQKSAIGEKLNLKELDFSNLTSTIQKAADRRSRPEGMPEHLGERGFRTRDDTPTRDGEAVDRKTLAEQITQGAGLESGQEMLGLDDEQIKNLYAVQNELNTTIDAGVYQGKQLTADQIKLLQNKQMELNKLIEAIEKAKAPVNVAYGGRIDKAFTGRSRDI